MVPYSQGTANYNQPTKELERLIKEDSNNVVIDKSSNILWMFGNVELKVDYIGNCLAIDTQVPTTNGFKEIKDVVVGDHVFDENGQPVKVVATTPIYKNRDCYKIKFRNGGEVISDENHEWFINVPTTTGTSKDNTRKTC